MSKQSHVTHMSGGFVAIIAFKYFKALIFLLIGFTAIHLARLSSMPTVAQVAHFFRVSPENEIVARLAGFIRDITPGQAVGVGVVAFLVAAVFVAEGTLLAAKVWWSTYFTIVLTMLGIPLEIYEILERPRGPRRYAILVINLAILIYLWRRRNEFKTPVSRFKVGGS